MTPVQRVLASLSTLKNPAYTGETRCTPCTLLNLAIAAATAAVIVTATSTVDTTVALGAGLATLCGAVAIIYFRGYLIPGTPTVTKRYFPPSFLALFDKAPDRTESTGADPQVILLDIGVVVDDPVAEDLQLEPTFVEAWDQSIATHWDDDTTIRRNLGRTVDADPTTLEFDERPHSFVVRADGVHLGSWPSRAACVADAAAGPAFAERDPDWDRRPLSLKADLLGVLRLFLERCPGCDGSVILSLDVVESCCRTRDVVAATCTDCDARLFEMDVDHDALATN